MTYMLTNSFMSGVLIQIIFLLSCHIHDNKIMIKEEPKSRVQSEGSILIKKKSKGSIERNFYIKVNQKSQLILLEPMKLFPGNWSS
jgi:predicted component of viral defense system (DUF524 family)